MIILKKVLEEAGMSIAAFAEKAAQATGIKISKSSAYLLLTEGRLPKKATEEFKEQIAEMSSTEFSETLKKLNIKKEEIFNEQEEEMATKRYETLSREAMKHFGMRGDPFPVSLTRLSEFLPLQSHLDALYMMEAAADNGGLVAVSGKVGSGKTTVLRVFGEKNRTEQRYNIVEPKSMDTARLTIKDVQHAIVYSLSEQSPKRSQEALGWQVEKLLKNRLQAGERTVLIIDEAHRLHLNTIKALKNLWEKREGMTSLVGIILIGQEELEDRLFGRGNTEIREVAARMTHVRLEPINAELWTYLSHKLKAAKTDTEKVITKDAALYLSDRFAEKDKNGIKDATAYPLDTDNTIKRLMNYCALTGEPVITPEVIRAAGI